MADKIVEQESPGRYGWGTTAAMNAFLKDLSNAVTPSQTILAVNIDTLVRNTAEGKMTIAEITKSVLTYMANIATDIHRVVGVWDNYSHYVIFYHCYPSIIPNVLRRQHNSPTYLKAVEAVRLILDKLKGNHRQVNGNMTAIVALANDLKQPSYKGLCVMFNELVDKGTVANMISHNPIDWHIQRLNRNGVMYRSYTGTRVQMTPSALGEVAFGLKSVPFYPLTHQLLGDKSYIKGLLVGKDREKFIEVCIQNRFSMRSENFINASPLINHKLIPYKL